MQNFIKALPILFFVAVIALDKFFTSCYISNPTCIDRTQLHSILTYLDPVYWFSLLGLLGGVAIAFTTYKYSQRLVRLFLWWIPLTTILVVASSGFHAGFLFPDVLSPGPIAFASGVIFSIVAITLVLKEKIARKP